MAFFSSSSLTSPHLSFKVDCTKLSIRSQLSVVRNQCFSFTFRSNSTELSGRQFKSEGANSHIDWSFIGGSKLDSRPKLPRPVLRRRVSTVQASWLTNAQIASSVFTLGTVAVLPFYTLMVVAPNAELTRKSMESSIPYIVLGLLYAYLLYLSWTPDTIRLMFGSKYLLPELPGIAKMFSNEMTLASAWIHLLGIDLFAARQVFYDGMQNKIETRHSISLCLLFCPVGVLTHFITKAVTTKSKHNM